MSYFPTVPGVYIVSTKFADEHIPGKQECSAHLFSAAKVLPSWPARWNCGWAVWFGEYHKS